MVVSQESRVHSIDTYCVSLVWLQLANAFLVKAIKLSPIDILAQCARTSLGCPRQGRARDCTLIAPIAPRLVAGKPTVADQTLRRGPDGSLRIAG